MYCNHCGRQLKEGGTFCDNCGMPIEEQRRAGWHQPPQGQPAAMGGPPAYAQMQRPPHIPPHGPAIWVQVVCILLAVVLGLGIGSGIGIAAAPDAKTTQPPVYETVSRYETSLLATMTAYTKARVMTEILLSENDLTFEEWNAECEATIRLWENAAQCAEQYAEAFEALPEAEKTESRKAESANQAGLMGRQPSGATALSVARRPTYGATGLASSPTASTSSLFKSIMGFPRDQRLAVLAKLQQSDIETASATLRRLQGAFAAECQQYSEKMNQREDTMHAMQDAAVAIRTGAKVGVFVCGAALTGGASASGSIGAAYNMYRAGKMTTSAMELGAMVVSGADLMLEAGQNTANIIVGNIGEKGAPVCVFFKGMADDFGSLRKVTEPVTAVINTAMVGNADAVGRALWFTDSMESYLNENKILGIELSGNRNVTVRVVKDADAAMFLMDAGLPGVVPRTLPSLRPGMG
ncbi:MAG: zinc ribbon domain-containing protein, partial [Clostridia bacterium]|nr:zinc ribbon domain-containing protein [Clostridia bacterium]